MKKILLFAGHDFKFLNNFIEKSKEKFNIIFDNWTGQTTHDKELSLQLLNKADIIFCEWCFGNIIFYSKYKKQHQKLYVRIHRTESSTDCWEKSNLYNIDKIFFVSKSWMIEHTKMKNVTDEKILSKYSYLYNDLSDIFKPQYDKIKIKLEDKNKILNIGFVGLNPSNRKCPLKCIPVLKKLSENYKINFYVIGKMPKDIEWMCQKPPHIFYERFQKGIDIFFKELSIINNIKVIKMGYIPNEKLYDIFFDINYLLIPSSNESFYKSALESLMAGCIPLFYGEYVTKFNAEMNWPKEFCFNNDNEVIEFINDFENKNDKYNFLKPTIENYWNKYNSNNVFNSFIQDIQTNYSKIFNIYGLKRSGLHCIIKDILNSLYDFPKINKTLHKNLPYDAIESNNDIIFFNNITKIFNHKKFEQKNKFLLFEDPNNQIIFNSMNTSNCNIIIIRDVKNNIMSRIKKSMDLFKDNSMGSYHKMKVDNDYICKLTLLLELIIDNSIPNKIVINYDMYIKDNDYRYNILQKINKFLNNKIINKDKLDAFKLKDISEYGGGSSFDNEEQKKKL